MTSLPTYRAVYTYTDQFGMSHWVRLDHKPDWSGAISSLSEVLKCRGSMDAWWIERVEVVEFHDMTAGVHE